MIAFDIPAAGALASAAVFLLVLALLAGCAYARLFQPRSQSVTPESVNYHFTRKCNYECGFCFHTDNQSTILKIDDAKRGLRKLKEAGMKKLNFSGGEPFLHERWLGKMVRFAKEELHLESITIVSNGSKVQEKWLKEHGQYVDILAISCDSFDPNTNYEIGRRQKSSTPDRKHIDRMKKISELCIKHDIRFKINSVINKFNVAEDMTKHISELNPCRWKVFQCLKIEGENSGEGAARNVDSFLITDEQFQVFVGKHKHLPCFVPENNRDMKDSYLILDEKMRFLNCQDGSKRPGPSLLDVSVPEALSYSGHDPEAYRRRGGVYPWSKPNIPKPTCAARELTDIEDLLS